MPQLLILDDESTHDHHYDAEIGINEISVKKLDGLSLRVAEEFEDMIKYNLVDPSTPNKPLGAIYIYRNL